MRLRVDGQREEARVNEEKKMTNYRHIQRMVISIAVALMLNRTGLAQSRQTEVRAQARVEARVRAPRPHPQPHIHVNDWENSELTVTEQETINKSYALPVSGERRSVIVDNVWGAVHVTGGASDQVQLVAKRTIRAESKDVNGPFRCQCNCDDCKGCNSFRDHKDYIVKYEFELQVPSDVDLTASTVNDGDVIVKDVSGKYSVHNVNGPVEMTNVAGSGTAKTINGELKVLFRGNPQTNSSFSSLNGDVDLYFLPKLSADLRFKTFNGEVFSDFQMSSLPPRQPEEQRTSGKFVFHADRFTGGRVAAGGPEIKIETLNGDIHIRERHE